MGQCATYDMYFVNLGTHSIVIVIILTKCVIMIKKYHLDWLGMHTVIPQMRYVKHISFSSYEIQGVNIIFEKSILYTF